MPFPSAQIKYTQFTITKTKAKPVNKIYFNFVCVAFLNLLKQNKTKQRINSINQYLLFIIYVTDYYYL